MARSKKAELKDLEEVMVLGSCTYLFANVIVGAAGLKSEKIFSLDDNKVWPGMFLLTFGVGSICVVSYFFYSRAVTVSIRIPTVDLFSLLNRLDLLYVQTYYFCIMSRCDS